MSSYENGESKQTEAYTDGQTGTQTTKFNSEEAFKNSYFETNITSAEKKRKLPPLLDHLKSKKDLKELFKCSLAVWIVTLFIVINPVLRAEGQALFFGW